MKQLLIIIAFFAVFTVKGQEEETYDFFQEIKNYDISDLWTIKEINYEFEGDTTTIERTEPLGYIGDNYQRFYIHFISAIQNPTNRLEYFIYGKTRVKSNICPFQGMIKIKEAKTYVNSYTDAKQGFVTGEYEFFEDSDLKGTGTLSGTFTTNFYIDNSGKIRYDALEFIADGFENNQFEGIWTSYKSKDSKKCNWGDFRIPDSSELDCGAGEFGVVDKYQANGWEIYLSAIGIKVGDLTVEKAKELENEKWWLDRKK